MTPRLSFSLVLMLSVAGLKRMNVGFFANFYIIWSSEIFSSELCVSLVSMTLFRRCILSSWRSLRVKKSRRTVCKALPYRTSFTTSNASWYFSAPCSNAFRRLLFLEFFWHLLPMHISKKDIPVKDSIAQSFAFGDLGSSDLLYSVYRKSLGKTAANIIFWEKRPEIVYMLKNKRLLRPPTSPNIVKILYTTLFWI